MKTLSSHSTFTFGDYSVMMGIGYLCLIPLLVGVSWNMWYYQIHCFVAIINNSVVIWFWLLLVTLSEFIDLVKCIQKERRE